MTKINQSKALAVAAAMALALCLLALVAVQPAGAAFPGTNGKIAYNRAFDYWSQAATFGSPETKLFDNAAHLAYSPDGSRVTFMRSNEIYVARADGSGTPRRNVTKNAWFSDIDPVFSPDGKKISFESSNPTFYARDIFRMPADGTRRINLTENYSVEANPSWQPMP